MNKIAYIMMFMIFCLPAAADIDVAGITGTVKSRSSSSESWKMLAAGTNITKSDFIKTGPLSFADLLFEHDNRFRIMENTEIMVSLTDNPDTLKNGKTLRLLNINLYNGTVGAKLDNLPDNIRVGIETPSAVAGALGTAFTVKTDMRTSNTTVSVIENRVLVSSNDSPDKTVVADAFKQVNVSPWKHTSLSATGTGVLSEQILGKQNVKNMREQFVFKSSGTGIDENEAKSTALFNLCEKLYSVKLSDEKTISDIVYYNGDIALRLLEAVSNAEIKGTSSDGKNNFTVSAEMKLEAIENIIGR
ncbi:MAG: FecR domain-containing protein, partial [bacterium]|nr:FecR domain-containing protein [bacterium]